MTVEVSGSRSERFDVAAALRFATARVGANLRTPFLAAFMFAALVLIALNYREFFGLALTPYDAQTACYPTYLNSLRTLYDNGLFAIYNPYNLGGQPTFPFFAQYDPIEMVPAFFGAIPDAYGYELIGEAHLFLVPLGCLMIAHAMGCRDRIRMLLVGLLSVAAAMVGPALIYKQWMTGFDGYCWGFVILGCLEQYFASRRLGFLIGAALAFDYAFLNFPENTFWPVFIIPYLIVNIVRASPKPPRSDFLLAIGVALFAGLPSLIVLAHFFATVAVPYTAHSGVIDDLRPHGVLIALGTPGRNLEIIALPLLLWCMAVLGLRALRSASARVAAAVAALFAVYSFAQLTPLCDAFRTLYFPAALNRRPDESLYVALPLLFYLAIGAIVATRAERISRTDRTAIIVAQAIVAVAGCLLWPDSWMPIAGLALVTCLIAANGTVGLLCVGLVLQWVAVCYVPFETSSWAAFPRDVQSEGLKPYAAILPFLPRRTYDSFNAYRVLLVGMPATFGPYAGAFRIYTVGSDYNSAFPKALIEKTQIEHPNAADMTVEIERDPAPIGARALEELGVKYYIFPPALFAEVRDRVMRRSNLALVPTGGAWTVVEDRAALPFVFARDAAGAAIPIDARMTRDRLRFDVPSSAVRLLLSYNYDTWWHARTDDGEDVSWMLASLDGQLSADARTLRGKRLTLAYYDVPFDVAMVLSIAVYLFAAFVLLRALVGNALADRLLFMRRKSTCIVNWVRGTQRV